MTTRIDSKKKTFISGLSANALAQGVTLAIQLGSLPIFLHFWSIEQYGVWIMLAAIPIYFNLCDGGIAAVTMNKMSMCCAKKEFQTANQEFQSGLFVITIGIMSLLVPVSICLFILASYGLFNHALALFLMILATLINLYSGIIDGIFRSTNAYALGTNLLTTARFVEWIGTITGLIIDKSILGAACGMFIGRAIAFISLASYSSKKTSIYKWGFSERIKGETIKTLSLSLKYTGLVIGNAINLQGTVILIGLMLGPSTAALYNTYRTMARITNQLIGAIGHTLWPQFTNDYSKGKTNEIRVALQSWTAKCTVLAIAMAILIYIAAPKILEIWARGKIPFDGALLTLMLVISLVGAAYNTLYILTLSTNSFNKMPQIYISIYVVQSLAIAFVSNQYGINAIAGLSIIAESLILLALLINSQKILQSNYNEYSHK